MDRTRWVAASQGFCLPAAISRPLYDRRMTITHQKETGRQMPTGIFPPEEILARRGEFTPLLR